MNSDEPKVAEDWLPLLYDELRRLAAQKLARETPGQTLDATALVHEAYLRLVSSRPSQPWENRNHFLSAAAEAMRRILIKRARHKQSLKRGGKNQKCPLDTIDLAGPDTEIDLLALNEALEKLERKA